MGLFSFTKGKKDGDYKMIIGGTTVEVAPGISMLIPQDWDLTQTEGKFKAQTKDESMYFSLQVFKFDSSNLAEQLEGMALDTFKVMNNRGIESTGEILRSPNYIGQYFFPVEKEDTDNQQFFCFIAIEPDLIGQFIITTTVGLAGGTKEFIEMMPHNLSRV